MGLGAPGGWPGAELSGTSGVGGALYLGSHREDGYDAAGNLRSIGYPTGQTIQYLPDAIDPARTSAVRLNGTQTLASGLTHKPFGPVSGLTFGNGIALAIQYDKNYQMGAIAATGIMDRTYAPDDVGNIVQIIDNLDNSRSQSFGYDDHYRLTAAAGIYGSIGYTYDQLGNRLTHTDAAGTDTYDYLGGTNKLRTVNGPHAKSYSYDAEGNTIAALGGQQPPLADQADYDYSNNGQRSKKVADSLTAISHYDQAGQLIAETDAAGTLIKAYVWLNGQPLAMLDAAGAVYYFHNDHLGTPQRMTDSTGAIAWSADYLPFGQADVTVAIVENNLRFAGQYYDNETGLHYNYWRYYDPKIGRYLRADPIGQRGGINRYLYAKDNPLRFVDPKGLNAASHTGNCSYYDDAYNQTGCQYYSDAKKWCERFNLLGSVNPTLNGWTTCVRRCLQIKDQENCRPYEDTCPDCAGVKRCNGNNHQYCYTACRYVDQTSVGPDDGPQPPPNDGDFTDWLFNGPIGDAVNWAAFY
ncbi:MAG: RHS domain-containing protein [Desulfobacterales bacterium]|nr:RHS domain-containing protein [Desulfobacterales bacterium]